MTKRNSLQIRLKQCFPNRGALATSNMPVFPKWLVSAARKPEHILLSTAAVKVSAFGRTCA